MPDSPPDNPDTVIVCPLFPWYSRLNHRFLGLGAMLLIFGGWFLLDGLVRWPKENEQVAQREAFIRNIDAAKTANGLEAWVAQARSQGLRVSDTLDLTSANIAEILWAATAAQKGWPEKPTVHTQAELSEQVILSAGMFIGFFILAAYLLMVKNRTLTGQADHLVTPQGKRIAFEDVVRIDKRKWDKQGLAYLFYKDGGTEKKAVIDDLQYDGAGKVLDRLLLNFHGELIEKLPDSDDETEGNDQTPQAGDP